MNMEALVEALENYRDTSLTRRNNRGMNKKPIQIVTENRTDLGPCWIVVSHSTNTHGYPQLSIRRKSYLIHKLVAEIVTGEDVPKGMTVSHLCENGADARSRLCINPRHIVLEPLADNIKRAKRTRTADGKFAAFN